jgi:hypothetical protein
MSRTRLLSRVLGTMSRQLDAGSYVQSDLWVGQGQYLSRLQTAQYSNLPEEYRKFYDGKAPTPRPRPLLDNAIAGESTSGQGVQPEDAALEGTSSDANLGPTTGAPVTGNDQKMAAQAGTHVHTPHELLHSKW